jgi:hypothetical protein
LKKIKNFLSDQKGMERISNKHVAEIVGNLDPKSFVNFNSACKSLESVSISGMFSLATLIWFYHH